jgi:hypothetical protein
LMWLGFETGNGNGIRKIPGMTSIISHLRF